MDLINVGDTVYLGFNGEVRKFQIYRIMADVVVLTWSYENVTQLHRVPKARLMELVAKGA